MTTNQHRANISDLHSRLSDIDQRLSEQEARLAKYDVIIERLDVLIDVLSQRVERLDTKAEEAIEGQSLLNERNEGTQRWAMIGLSLASSTIVGVLMFLLGHALH